MSHMTEEMTERPLSALACKFCDDSTGLVLLCGTPLVSTRLDLVVGLDSSQVSESMQCQED